MNLQAIYPPLPQRTLLRACTSCGGDVRTDNGFADMDGTPWKAYLCQSCTITAVGTSRAVVLIGAAQEQYRKARSPVRASKLAAIALAVLTTGAVQAATIGVDTVSLHIPAETYLSGINPGAYVRFDNGATMGAYRNSFGRLSLWAGYTAEAGPFALTAGIVSGYQMKTTTAVVPCRPDQETPGAQTVCTHSTTLGHTRGAIGPLLAPSVRFPAVLGVTTRLTLLPKFSAKGHTVLHLSAEF